MKAKKASWGVMLNAYPDSIGGTLADIVGLLKRPEFREAFTSFYILPSIFNTDLDRGFSLIDYGLSETLASPEALEELKALGIDLALDFILNHTSVLSKEFQDILKRGDDSPYRDFFIDWNRFWDGHGTMTEDGYIQHTCDCGDSYREPLPAGHTWGEWLPAGDGKEVRYCDACGAEDYRTREEDTYSVQMLFLHWLFPRIHQK